MISVNKLIHKLSGDIENFNSCMASDRKPILDGCIRIERIWMVLVKYKYLWWFLFFNACFSTVIIWLVAEVVCRFPVLPEIGCFKKCTFKIFKRC